MAGAAHITRQGAYHFAAAALAIAGLTLPAQTQARPHPTPPHAALKRADAEPSPLSLPPRIWAADAANNELQVIERSDPFLRYRMHVIDEKGDQVRDVIESRDGTVARLIERNHQPLTEDEDKAEQQRLNDMIADPEKYRKHVGNDTSGRRRAAEMIRLLPDAMVFTYAPGQPQLEDFPAPLVVLDYTPNKDWHPPSTTSEALTGLQGRVWIDTRTHHMVRMEGDVFQGVNLGWGLLAHIYPGGKLMIQQTPVDGARWIFSKFTEQITVRALMVKTFKQNARVNAENFAQIPSMGYQDAIRTLLATPLPRTALPRTALALRQ